MELAMERRQAGAESVRVLEATGEVSVDEVEVDYRL